MEAVTRLIAGLVPGALVTVVGRGFSPRRRVVQLSDGKWEVALDYDRPSIDVRLGSPMIFVSALSSDAFDELEFGCTGIVLFGPTRNGAGFFLAKSSELGRY